MSEGPDVQPKLGEKIGPLVSLATAWAWRRADPGRRGPCLGTGGVEELNWVVPMESQIDTPAAGEARLRRFAIAPG